MEASEVSGAYEIPKSRIVIEQKTGSAACVGAEVVLHGTPDGSIGVRAEDLRALSEALVDAEVIWFQPNVLARPPEIFNPVEGLVIDVDAREVELCGHSAGLVYREFELLVFLVRNKNKYFSKPHIIAEVWGSEHAGNISPANVVVQVKRVRGKLGDFKHHLRTRRNVGYGFFDEPEA